MHVDTCVCIFYENFMWIASTVADLTDSLCVALLQGHYE